MFYCIVVVARGWISPLLTVSTERAMRIAAEYRAKRTANWLNTTGSARINTLHKYTVCSKCRVLFAKASGACGYRRVSMIACRSEVGAGAICRLHTAKKWMECTEILWTSEPEERPFCARHGSFNCDKMANRAFWITQDVPPPFFVPQHRRCQGYVRAEAGLPCDETASLSNAMLGKCR